MTALESPFAAAELEKEALRIEEVLTEIGRLASPQVRSLAQELVECLLDYHGGALERMLDAADGAGEAGAALTERWLEDPLVANTLLLHGLHPVPVEDRVRRALEKVRPSLQTHNGDAELVRVEEGKAVIRLLGGCRGCPSSAQTVKNGIEAAILSEAPDIVAVEVEGEAAP
jgi:Fe-S cluster biogenesis protein NfuA